VDSRRRAGNSTEGLHVASREAREHFVATVLGQLAAAGNHPNEQEVVLAVGFAAEELHWPARQPGVLVNDLMMHIMTRADEQRYRIARESLQLLLAALAPIDPPHQAFFARSQRKVVNMLLSALKEDLIRVRSGQNPRAYPLAVVLAANYTAIDSLDQRHRLILLLEKLNGLAPESYGDPFLTDLTIVYRKLGLRELGRKYRASLSN
jgi:hypothetical protein